MVAGVQRLENWPKLLSNYLTMQRFEPFVWGENDCLCFAAKAVQAMTGADFMAAFPAYETEAEARAILEANGGVMAIINTCLGEPSMQIKKASRGDVALVMMPDATAGIVDDTGQRIAVVTKAGLLRVPLTKAIRVWGF